jgi:hypothetical protein
MEIGNIVIFLGCDQDQINWGNNDSPNENLIVGNEYVISLVELHSWHTKISVVGCDKKFNSVCFRKKQ